MVHAQNRGSCCTTDEATAFEEAYFTEQQTEADRPNSWKSRPWRLAGSARQQGTVTGSAEDDEHAEAASGDNDAGEQQAASTQSTALAIAAAVEAASDASQSRMGQMEEYADVPHAGAEESSSDQRWSRRLASWPART